MEVVASDIQCGSSRKCQAEYHKLVIDVQSGIERFPKRDTLGADEVIIGLDTYQALHQLD